MPTTDGSRKCRNPTGRASWGNPLSLAPADADRLHLKNGDMVSLGRGPALPILRQPGQAQGVLRMTLAMAAAGSVAAGVGTRAWAFASALGARSAPVDAVTPTGGRQELSLAQEFTTPRNGREHCAPVVAGRVRQAAPTRTRTRGTPSLYDKQDRRVRVGMAIDLSSCVAAAPAWWPASRKTTSSGRARAGAQGPRHALDAGRPLLPRR